MTTVTHKEATTVTRDKPRTQVEENAEKARSGHSPDALGGLQNDANPEARNPNPTAIQPKEGSEPGEGLVPHPGGAFAKAGDGGFAGGCVPDAPTDPAPTADAAKGKDAHARR